MNRTVKTMIYCALFAALTAVCSQLAIPMQHAGCYLVHTEKGVTKVLVK